MPNPTHPPYFSTPPTGGLQARSDEQLVALLRQGRPGAFDTLVARYQARLLWFCWKFLRSKEDAEDALQDVFVAAFRSLVADERDVHVRPWLYRIARNRCINQLRRTPTVAIDSLTTEDAASEGTPVELLVSRQQFRELVDDVHALPDTQRTALLLREIDGFAYQQIADAMDKSVPGVKSLLVRARIGLRDSSAARDASLLALAPRCARTPRPKRPRSHTNMRPISYRAARAAVDAAA